MLSGFSSYNNSATRQEVHSADQPNTRRMQFVAWRLLLWLGTTTGKDSVQPSRQQLTHVSKIKQTVCHTKNIHYNNWIQKRARVSFAYRIYPYSQDYKPRKSINCNEVEPSYLTFIQRMTDCPEIRCGRHQRPGKHLQGGNTQG
ncbi:uncharacterized protein LOC119581753 [Penaeus monodon]|uniref:uncharacterized protein LOC119581753 n=1 Tax=Penaeus monodon TaxID=6687 RepID=UPI0018A79987|nr:uncharacterized protein LOC119581753 [Penaeus monodon]